MVLKFKISLMSENWTSFEHEQFGRLSTSARLFTFDGLSTLPDQSLLTDRSLSIDRRCHWTAHLELLPNFIKNGFLRTPHPHPGHDSYFSLFRIDMKEFVEKYMCPSLNIHLASYCKGRKKPCVRCDSLDTERKTWSFTKCIPNKQLIYDKRGVTDIREVCHKGKSNFCHILLIKYTMGHRFFEK